MTASSERANREVARYSLSAYKPIAEKLLKRHRLRVPEGTVETLTKTIYGCLVLEPRARDQRADRLSPRKRLGKARNAVQRLLVYSEHRPSRRSSIPTQIGKLRDALDFAGVGVWLAPTEPVTPIPALLEKLNELNRKGFNDASKATLTELLHALERSLARRAKTTGRPRERLRLVVRGGCAAWRRAKKAPSCSWDQRAKAVRGKLAVFIRDLIKICEADMSETALYSALREAMRR